MTPLSLPFDPAAPLAPFEDSSLDNVLYRFLCGLALDEELHPRLGAHMSWYTDEVEDSIRSSAGMLRASHLRMLQLALAHDLWQLPADLTLGATAEGRSASGVAAEGLLLGGAT